MTWKDDLSDEYKASPAFADIGDDINDLAKNYLDAQSHIGASIRIPGEDASEEDRSAFYQKLVDKAPGLIPTPDLEDPASIEAFMKTLGKPDVHTDYEVPGVEGVQVDDNRIKLMQESALEVGMTKKQFSNFLTKMYEADAMAIDVAANSVEEDALSLKKDWGVTHENRMKALEDKLKLSDAPPELVAAVKAQTAGSETVKWLDAMFEKFSGETGEINNQPGDASNDGVDVAEAIARATEIRNKLTKGDVAHNSPEYAALLKKLLKYEQMAKPDSSNKISDLQRGFTSGR